jgi:hypothetical protein
MTELRDIKRRTGNAHRVIDTWRYSPIDDKPGIVEALRAVQGIGPFRGVTWDREGGNWDSRLSSPCPSAASSIFIGTLSFFDSGVSTKD